MSFVIFLILFLGLGLINREYVKYIKTKKTYFKFYNLALEMWSDAISHKYIPAFDVGFVHFVDRNRYTLVCLCTSWHCIQSSAHNRKE